jgi:hypothetical protein
MSDTPKPSNLDLIRMVQQARIDHDRTAVPSDVSATYWIEFKCPLPMPPITPRSGEFRLYTTLATVDADWEKIKAATEAGRLGYKSKVSTRPTPDHPTPDGRTICVRTHDGDDTQDVNRVRDELARLGFSPTMYSVDQPNQTL